MQLETRFKEKVRPKLNDIPGSAWVKTKEKSIRGVPDFVGVVRGWSILIELKTDKKGSKVDSLQEWRLKRWSEAGALTFVMRPSNMDDILEILHNLPDARDSGIYRSIKDHSAKRGRVCK